MALAPEVSVTVGDGKLIVADNGPGIPEKTVQALPDFSVRVSSREAYISPTRGAQGNALKTVIAMPFALDGSKGRIAIETHGAVHDIEMSVDQVRQQPHFKHTCAASSVKNGTRITVFWPNPASLILANARPRFLQMATGFTVLNPHLSLALSWDGAQIMSAQASDPGWKKWRPSDPIPALWPDGEQFERLVAAHIRHDSNNGGRTVREFIARELRGFSGSQSARPCLTQPGSRAPPYLVSQAAGLSTGRPSASCTRN